MTTSVAHVERFVWPVAAFAVLAATVMIQSSLVSPSIEELVRFSAVALGLLGVPTLLVLAVRDWYFNHREHLFPWRNGLGITSIVAVFYGWLFYWGIGVMHWVMPVSSHFAAGLEWDVFFLCGGLLGFILGFALRGAARPQAIAAAILMWACVEASIVV